MSDFGAMGISEDAAQKRVSRAVERLRAFFAKRGVAIGTSALTAALAANAVQAAPAGMALTVCTLAALAKSSSVAVATGTAIKTIAMTTLHKTMIGGLLAAAVGMSLYEVRKAQQAQDHVQALQQKENLLSARLQQVQRERDDATGRLATLQAENERLSSNKELQRLRGQVGVLRQQAENGGAKTTSQPPLSTAREYWIRAGENYIKHDYEAQLADLNKAIELDPNFAEAYSDRAGLYALNLPTKYGGYEKAVADYTRYLELKPNECAALHNRGLFYEKLDQYDNAIADYGTAGFRHRETELIWSLVGQNGRFARPPQSVIGRRCCAAQTSIASPANLMHAARMRDHCTISPMDLFPVTRCLGTPIPRNIFSGIPVREARRVGCRHRKATDQASLQAGLRKTASRILGLLN